MDQLPYKATKAIVGYTVKSIAKNVTDDLDSISNDIYKKKKVGSVKRLKEEERIQRERERAREEREALRTERQMKRQRICDKYNISSSGKSSSKKTTSYSSSSADPAPSSSSSGSSSSSTSDEQGEKSCVII